METNKPKTLGEHVDAMFDYNIPLSDFVERYTSGDSDAEDMVIIANVIREIAKAHDNMISVAEIIGDDGLDSEKVVSHINSLEEVDRADVIFNVETGICDEVARRYYEDNLGPAGSLNEIGKSLEFPSLVREAVSGLMDDQISQISVENLNIAHVVIERASDMLYKKLIAALANKEEAKKTPEQIIKEGLADFIEGFGEPGEGKGCPDRPTMSDVCSRVVKIAAEDEHMEVLRNENPQMYLALIRSEAKNRADLELGSSKASTREMAKKSLKEILGNSPEGDTEMLEKLARWARENNIQSL
jgi:hypothetical protein